MGCAWLEGEVLVPLDRLEVRGLRNLADQIIELDSRLVVVVGANAQGKSSLLEAIYLLATTRSFRTREPREAIAYESETCFVRGTISRPGDASLEISVGRSRGRGERQLRVGQYIVKLADYLEHLPALVMTGESTRSIAGSPSERRRYMDRATASAVPSHLPDLAEYKRALAQRNQLLREEASDEELDPWDEILASVGERIATRREEQVRAWQELLGSWPELFPEACDAQMHYRRVGVSAKGAVEAPELAQRLRAARASDRRTRVTSVGPHRDDLGFEVQGRDIWRYGSAGQLRSALAATTFAQARRVHALRPSVDRLLILDDVDSDLDKARFDALLEAARAEGQTFAASSKPALAVGLDACVLDVRAGRITARDRSEGTTGRR